VLSWSFRTVTKAGQKRPNDWEDRCLLTFLRLSRSVLRYNIKSPRMIVNADQTGISLFPLGNKTWEVRGSKQVPAQNHDEKRQVRIPNYHVHILISYLQYTLVVASSNGGISCRSSRFGVAPDPAAFQVRKRHAGRRQISKGLHMRMATHATGAHWTRQRQ
jgi:hypothetical protein